ncbi:MAG: enoyl-CoA hydratase-related protein [Pseudomonadota bacterium]
MTNAEYRYETIDVAASDSAHWLTLNRPQRLNAMSGLMCDELTDYFHRLYTDHAVRVVVLQGKGRAFCSGFDLKDINEVSDGPAAGMRAQRRVSEIVLAMRRCPQPIVALLHGAAAGGGLALGLASDVRIVADDVRMNVAMATVGLTGCDIGISYFLPRAVGSSVAAELMMTGRFIDAERALRTGLVSEVSTVAELGAAGEAMVEDMLKLSPLGLRLTKDGLNMSLAAPSLEHAISMEDRGQILCASAGYFEEGISAFREKRTPNYVD